MIAITPSLQEFEVQVPASIANLGAGFDTLAVAVQLYLRLRATIMPGRGHLQFRFIDHELRGDNYIERAYRQIAGEHFDDLPALSIEVCSEIPMGAGLGSSAAAVVAGLRLYSAVAGPLPPQTMLELASSLEGHPDNASAALLGGLTASCQLPDGSVRAVRFSWPESLHLLVLTPDEPLATSGSRAILPSSLPLADTVHNLQRVALFLHAVQSRDLSLLKCALQDRLHQPIREKIVPGLKEALKLQHPDLLGVCLSGSGPSVVALAERNFATIAQLLASIYDQLRITYTIRTLRVHQEGRQQIGSAEWPAVPRDDMAGNCRVSRLA